MLRVLSNRLRWALIATVVVTGAALAGCGGATMTVTHTTTSTARSPNDAVIAQAAKAKDNQAQLGAGAIRTILVRKLGLDSNDNFNLGRPISPDDIASDSGDCYVKLGADAVNFENQSENILAPPADQMSSLCSRAPRRPSSGAWSPYGRRLAGDPIRGGWPSIPWCPRGCLGHSAHHRCSSRRLVTALCSTLGE
jgi:hypothetical protein